VCEKARQRHRREVCQPASRCVSVCQRPRDQGWRWRRLACLFGGIVVCCCCWARRWCWRRRRQASRVVGRRRNERFLGTLAGSPPLQVARRRLAVSVRAAGRAASFQRLSQGRRAADTQRVVGSQWSVVVGRAGALAARLLPPALRLRPARPQSCQHAEARRERGGAWRHAALLYGHQFAGARRALWARRIELAASSGRHQMPFETDGGAP